ncbi:MAG: methyltransferase domain-containing protein [Desulfobulbus sp.]|nr:methyltransferase domain-containing protein [Desulfobulbus sp.]
MSGPVMLAHLIRERLSWRELQPRIPEPDLVMDNAAQNAAFALAGREDGILGFVYLYHALQVTALVRPGDRVLDLGCGPANQLAQIARLNPEARFTGLDASARMLESARETIQRRALPNIELRQGDMTTLAGIDDAAFDCVISTVALHHLPDCAALAAAMRAARRVLKAGGGVYFVDFGRLKHLATQKFFSEDRRSEQPEAMTQDYYHSLRAAFSLDELWQAAHLAFGADITRHATALAPFMAIIGSAGRRELDESTRQIGRAMYAAMTKSQQKDFRLYARWLKAGGLDLPFPLH